MTEYLVKLAKLEKLIRSMDIPAYKKSVKQNTDVRWLKHNLGTRNSNHPNYAEAMQLIEQLV